MCKPVSSRCRDSSIAASTSTLFLRMLPPNVAWLLVFHAGISDLQVIVRLQLRLPQPIKHIDKGQQQLGDIAGIHNVLTPCFGPGPDFLVEHLPSLQDLQITQGEKGDVLNER